MPTSPSSITMSSFSTGTDSPVKAASSIFNEATSIKRRSAGTTSPASSITISPGTRSVDFTELVCPSRKTFAFGVDISRSASIACSALDSCTTPITALIITTARIMIESTTSCETTAEITAANSKTMIIKSLNCSKKRASILFFSPSSSSFKPYSFRRFSASADVSPSSVV